MTRAASRPRGVRVGAPAAVAAGLVYALAWLGGGAAPPARATESLIVRVGILVERPSVRIGADGPVTFEDGARPAGAGPGIPLAGAAWTIAPGPAGGLDVSGAAMGPVVRVTAQTGMLRADGRPYRGVLEVRLTPSGRITVVNELDLESYLYGVIKGEVDPRWPPQAVRAQAVAARTLAVQRLLAARSGEARATAFDLPATTDAQVYLGRAAEDPAATAAVDATRGLLVTYEDRPIFAAYHSNSGGHTEDSENVWGTVYPYLRGVPDPYALDAPGVRWNASLSLGTIASALRRGGIDAGPLDDVAPGRVTPWGRAVTVRVHGTGGQTEEINANRFRLLLGPDIVRSTMFTVSRRGPAVEFAGRGSGHGVGLDQWGARAMAVKGFTFEQILKYYYTDIAIEERY